MTWQQGLLRVAADRSVTGQMLSVLLVILATIDFGSSTSITQAEIALRLKMKRQNVNLTINRLVASGIISKRTEGGKIIGYRVNEHFGYLDDANYQAD